MTTFAVAAAVVLLALNAVFVAVEFALIAARRQRVEELADLPGRRGRRARRSLLAMSDLNRQLAGAQLGITMASLALGFLAEPAVASVLEDWIDAFADLPSGLRHTIAGAIALTLVVFLHLVLGEMLPKNLAIAEPESVLLRLATFNWWYVRILGPLIWTLNQMANLVVRLLGVRPVDALGTAHTAQEFVTLLDRSRGEGLIDELGHTMLAGVLDFRQRPVREVMVPRAEIVAVARVATVAEIEALARESGHSRLPVVGALGLDEVLGFVPVRDLLSIERTARDLPLGWQHIRRMLVVPGHVTLENLLLTMQRRRSHFAVVRDEGTTVGIVTLEDVLEELVGDIIDESDRDRALTMGRGG